MSQVGAQRRVMSQMIDCDALSPTGRPQFRSEAGPPTSRSRAGTSSITGSPPEPLCPAPSIPRIAVWLSRWTTVLTFSN